MTSCETVRTIPLIIERDTPMEDVESGYPFEREDREDPFRSELDDIANRHPEFAEHLGGFPFRSDSLGRRFRQNRPSEEEFSRFGRPFGSRFERFGFPFNRDPFQDDFEEPKPQQAQPEPKQETQPPQKQQENPPPERGRKQQNIQQSNTVDLGQKQEPVNERNQRSMSAPPPDNRQRYTSSIHIPINREGMAEMGAAQSQSQPPQQDKPINKPTERVIPIHVEGRDEPVIPKHTGPSYTQQQQPQPERIFGHRPSQFTQFVGRESPKPEWQQQHQQGPEVRQQKFQQTAPPPPPPPQQEVPVQKPQEQPPPPKPSNNPIDIIQSIQKDVSELMSQVEKFNGVPKDKQYLYLDEMLTRNLIKLDNIDTQGQENIRQARKEAIKCIESCIGILEAKAAANVPQAGETPERIKDESQEKMEVEVKEEEPKVEEKVETKSEPEVKEEKMEVAPPAAPTMEVVAEPVVEPPKEEKPKESETETKPTTGEEMKDESKTDETKEEASEEKEDNKEKKKGGKKKVVKK